MKSWSRRFSEKYIQLISGKSLIITLIALAVMTASVFYTKNNLKLDTKLSSLLPKNTPSVLALEESSKRFGSSDKFIIVIQSDDVELIAKLQDSIKTEIDTAWKDFLISSQIARDNSFFKKHALLYLPVHHLERIRNNLEVIQKEMGTSINPFLVNLEEEEKGPKKTSKQVIEELEWFDADIPQELGLPDEAADAFTGFLEKKDKSEKAEKKGEEWDPKAVLPPHLKTRLIGQNRSDSTINGVILCKLSGSSTDLEFTKMILDKANAVIDRYKEKYGDKVHMGIRGSYEGLQDVEAMWDDSFLATIISIVLMIVLIIAFFRSVLSAILLLGQVLFATALMLFFTAAFYGQLNLYSLFVAAIIIGMGIDFSIHLMGTAQRMNKKLGLQESLVEALDHMISPMFLAALTTVAGLLTLLIADFRGFYEFGVIASVGVTLSFLSAVLGLPVLITLIGGLPKSKQPNVIPASWSEEKTRRFSGKFAAFTITLLLVLAFFIPKAEFEHNFRKLRPAPKEQPEGAKKEKKLRYGIAMASSRTGSQPAAVLGDTPEELDKLYDTLMHRLHVEKEPMLRSFLTLKTFVPNQEDQEERMELIEEIGELIQTKAFNKVEGEEAEMVEKLRDMSEVEPFTAEDIPEWALSVLKEKDGKYGTIGFIYGKYKSWDAREMRLFQEKYGHWNFGGKDLRVYSSAFISADVIKAVQDDSLIMGLFMFIVLTLTLALSLRNFRMIIISIIPLASAVIMTIGIMGVITVLMDLGKVTVFNVIVVPMAMGVGIDATIHMLHSSFRDRGRNMKEVFNSTGLMVIMASLTTACGFTGLLFINHNGLKTIGELAVIAILCTLITALSLTPWLSFKLLNKKK
jgi:predicted RND superfamily exporter protein